MPESRSAAVFLDRSGVRRRLTAMIGAAVGVGLLASLGLLVVGLSGAPAVDLPGFPDGGRADQGAVTTPVPDRVGGPTLTRPGRTLPVTTPAATPSPTREHPGRRNPSRTPHPRPTKAK
jgi:hypothetical protein